MSELLEVKFTNDNDLSNFLLDTGSDTMLYEATFHWKWGCGHHLGQTKEMIKEKVKGNLMGTLLMSLRASILNAAEAAERSSDGESNKSGSSMNTIAG